MNSIQRSATRPSLQNSKRVSENRQPRIQPPPENQRTKSNQSLQSNQTDKSNSTNSSKKHKKEDTGVQVFMTEESESARHKKIDSIFHALNKHNEATNKDETKTEVTKMLKSVSYGLKYDPSLRSSCEPRDFANEVNEQLCKEMDDVIEAQEQILRKLEAITEKFTKTRLQRYSLTNPNPNSNTGMNSLNTSCCDLSGVQNESVMDGKVNIPDILDYCSEYMVVTNRIVDYVSEANAAVDNHVDNTSEFTVYEDLLNAFDMN